MDQQKTKASGLQLGRILVLIQDARFQIGGLEALQPDLGERAKTANPLLERIKDAFKQLDEAYVIESAWVAAYYNTLEELEEAVRELVQGCAVDV